MPLIIIFVITVVVFILIKRFLNSNQESDRATEKTFWTDQDSSAQTSALWSFANNQDPNDFGGQTSYGDYSTDQLPMDLSNDVPAESVDYVGVEDYGSSGDSGGSDFSGGDFDGGGAGGSWNDSSS